MGGSDASGDESRKDDENSATLSDGETGEPVKDFIDWGLLYGRATAMGWTPTVFNDHTLTEFRHCFRGWQRAQGIDPDAPAVKLRAPMSRGEAEELFEKYG